MPLRRQSVRWLRVEATHGARLAGTPLSVRLLFDPRELVFVAGSGDPYTLAAGRAGTTAAALPLAMLTGTADGGAQALPVARVGEVKDSAPAGRPAWAAWLPPGTDARTLGLWAVLAAGVLVLGAVAWSLLRQLGPAGKSPP